jgi:hypothetical protein
VQPSASIRSAWLSSSIPSATVVIDSDSLIATIAPASAAERESESGT